MSLKTSFVVPLSAKEYGWVLASYYGNLTENATGALACVQTAFTSTFVFADRAQEAEKCYLKALSIKPNSADGNINLAHLLRVTKRFNEADVQYQKALSLRPNNPQLNYFHGVVLEKLGKRKVKYN